MITFSTPGLRYKSFNLTPGCRSNSEKGVWNNTMKGKRTFKLYTKDPCFGRFFTKFDERSMTG